MSSNIGQPGYVPLYWTQGANNQETLVITWDGNTRDWTNCTAKLFCRESPTDTASALLFRLSTTDGTIVLQDDGTIKLLAVPFVTKTANLGSDRSAYYQLWITDYNTDPPSEWCEFEGPLVIEGSYGS